MAVFSKAWLGGVSLAAASLAFASPGWAGSDAIRIGVLTDMSSVYSTYTGPGSVEAVNMAVEEMGGTINGKPIEVIFADHLNKADVASGIAREWFDQKDVDVIVDLPNSAVALAVIDVAKSKGKPLLISGGASSDITNKACSELTLQWTLDTRQIASSVVHGLVGRGDDWFLLLPNYTFGDVLANDMQVQIQKLGGSVTSIARPPLETSDYSSYLLQVMAAKPSVFAYSAGNLVTATKQAAEFGVLSAGMSVVAVSLVEADVAAIGLEDAQGLLTAAPFVPDRTPAVEEWSSKFKERVGRLPSYFQAGLYSAVRHYLAAAKETQSDDPKVVIGKMRAMPVNDIFAENGTVRKDGVMVHEWFLRQVKEPGESKGPDDLFKTLGSIKGENLVRPLSESECPLVTKG